ncbi:chromosome segregation SMC family protein [Treponema brennaborense]|uniref:Chromosome partition protein Smc n=1 Tax=Treponema brennaborense (strain DSM 12168 / CIP 105900 / DD5/3) TaxID=906968 RepID=F4LPD0_TREBD|nr:AAA family ATPase [Treponema brennaborense]AEE16992.1 chromosome segregation protein SMC [Treponema brennaborense DSM 12168]
MFLKSLEVFGFKSFADRTRIEFSDGITALLGPNGCGKSNVVDAVKWVLGEQGAKNMRAEKMEDVIFNGTETRKPLNVAEVTLTIANENGLLPLDVSEIMIKRRLYRSGESEYYINNAQVKLKDVRELFWDTGVGKAAYSVMEQGKIDQILSSKPEDRRYLFEEAAGITRFKVKRAEAERKLERTEENMRQVEGIMGEVKRSYDTLKVQADKTISYRKFRDDIFNYELDIQLLRLKNFTQDRDRCAADAQKAANLRDGARAEIDAINASLSENMEEVNAMEGQLVSMQKEIYGLAVERNEKDKQAKQLSERKAEAKAKVSQLEGRFAALEERIGSLREDIDEQDAGLHAKRRRIDEITGNIDSFQDNITLAGTQITENDRQAAECEADIAALDAERAELRKELESITEDIVTELDSRLKDAGYSSKVCTAAREKVDALLGKLAVLSSGRKNIFTDFASLAHPAEADVKRFALNAVDAFTEAERLLAELGAAIGEYTASTPQFIDEFLSPEGIITRKRSIDRKIQDSLDSVNRIRDRIAELKSENAGLVGKIEEYRATLEQLRIQKAQMQTQIEAAEDQIRILRRELSLQENSLRELENELFTEKKRFDDIHEQLIEIEGEIASIEYKGRSLTEKLEELERNITSRNSDVSGKKEALSRKTADMAKFQSQLEKYTLDLATSETEIRNIKDNFRETHSRDLMEFEERMFTITVPAAELREKLAETRQQLKSLGSVNLMAPEEFAETKERHDFLAAQIADLQKAREDLQRITEEIRAESTELFLATYNKIKKNFHNMFRRLFGGGRAELRLVDPHNVLESGIDIFAQPPGKKLENIALLSGGEKTMTAVSLLFATYMVRPSPFCLLDEIDAALDEQNVLRFVHTLRDFANVSQYIVITHNKKTVSGAGTMLGVTMEESGVSKVITIRLENEAGAGVGSLADPEPFIEEDVEPETDVYIPPHPPKRIRPAAVSGEEGVHEET